jgi:hypothetical protein
MIGILDILQLLPQSFATNRSDGTSTHTMKGLLPYLQRNGGNYGKVLQFGTEALQRRTVVLEKSFAA